MSAKKVLLIIMDGWGLSPSEEGNAPLVAKTPVLDFVYSTYPKTSLSASGLEVGLNPGEPGNSEVGHMNIGSGRLVWENLPRIDQAIESGEFAKNETLLATIDNAKKNDSALHLIGLVSDGGVHGHIRHLEAIIDLAAKSGLKKVYIHFIADGRDTESNKAPVYVEQIEAYCQKVGAGQIVSIIGRYFAMDRDKNWERSKKAFNLFANAEGTKYPSAKEAIEVEYQAGKSDEFLEPAVIGEGVTISPNDSIILFNYRSDRALQLLHLFGGEEGAKLPIGLRVATMVQYEKEQRFPAIFSPISLTNTLSEVVSKQDLSQFHTAETEKYAHVTYFFKGTDKVFEGETDKIVPSKKVATYDKLPEMSAKEVTLEVQKALKSRSDFIVVNFANGDMVGHTGVMDAAVKACETIDGCLGQILSVASTGGYKVFLTADHGNCETMIDESTKAPNKEHTTNPVPLVFLDLGQKPYNFVAVPFSQGDYIQYATGTPIGVLADIAPSILASLELAKSEEMTGMDLTAAMI